MARPTQRVRFVTLLFVILAFMTCGQKLNLERTPTVSRVAIVVPFVRKDAFERLDKTLSLWGDRDTIPCHPSGR